MRKHRMRRRGTSEAMKTACLLKLGVLPARTVKEVTHGCGRRYHVL